MKKLLFTVSALALGITAMVAGHNPAVNASNVPECKVATVGTQNSANHPKSKFQIANNVATVKYEVTGKKGCKVTVAAKSYYTLKQGGLPREAQKLFATTTKTVGKGTHKISVSLPPAGCYYQVDFVRVIEGQKNEMLGYQLKGDRSCIDRDIKVCVLDTKQVETIKLSEWYKNKSAYSRDLNDCVETPEVGELNVCDLTTGKVVTIKETDFDATKYSKDVNDDACTEVEEHVLPAKVASTGPAETFASLVGAGSLAASAGYYFQSRRGLFRR